MGHIIIRPVFGLEGGFGREIGGGARVKTGLDAFARTGLLAEFGLTDAGLGFEEAGDGTGVEPVAGHLKSPFWRKKTSSFSLSALLPRRAFKVLQHATQFSSALLPPFAEATRCSTLASDL